MSIKKPRFTYAIVFSLHENVKGEWADDFRSAEHHKNPYDIIGDALSQKGFIKEQEGVYYGDKTVNAVSCVLTATWLSKKLPWFSSAIKSINMLRIEEISSLTPALQKHSENSKYNDEEADVCNNTASNNSGADDHIPPQMPSIWVAPVRK